MILYFLIIHLSIFLILNSTTLCSFAILGVL